MKIDKEEMRGFEVGSGKRRKSMKERRGCSMNNGWVERKSMNEERI